LGVNDKHQKADLSVDQDRGRQSNAPNIS